MNETSATPSFTADGLPTLIGSLPTPDHQTALEWIFSSTPQIPLWPQLPINPLEGMISQFVENIPGLVETAERTYFDITAESFAEEQLSFYEDYLRLEAEPTAPVPPRFQVSSERAAGLYLLGERAADMNQLAGLKGQITGPFTMLTGITDQNERLGYYDPTIRDMVVKSLAMKAGWQVRFLQQSRNLPVLLFIDEPALAGLGSSAFISITPEDIAQDLAEVTSAIHLAGGLAGVHVCANTDWNLLLTSTIDILSFDAYGFFDRFITCKPQIHDFLNRGGIIAWGLIPTSEAETIAAETPERLIKLWEAQAAGLTTPTWDLPRLLRQTLITPSCGTGSLSQELARKVLTLTSAVSDGLRRKYLPTA